MEAKSIVIIILITLVIILGLIIYWLSADYIILNGNGINYNDYICTDIISYIRCLQ